MYSFALISMLKQGLSERDFAITYLICRRVSISNLKALFTPTHCRDKNKMFFGVRLVSYNSRISDVGNLNWFY